MDRQIGVKIDRYLDRQIDLFKVDRQMKVAFTYLSYQ